MRRRLRHLPVGLAASAALVAVAGPVGWATGGAAGLLAVAAGVLLVTGSFVLGGLVVAWADSVAPALVLPVGLAAYIAKFSVLGVVLVGLQHSNWTGLGAFAWSALATVLTWVGAQVWWVWHARIPYVTLDDH